MNLRELKKKTSNCLILLVGNKIDLIEKRRVNVDDVRNYARDNNIIYMESSAKTGTNVDQIFTNIAHNLPEEPDDIRIHEPLDITIRDEKKIKVTPYKQIYNPRNNEYGSLISFITHFIIKVR